MTTAQEIFDAAWKRAETRVKSMMTTDYFDACAYRAPDGTACFVGVQLSEDEYDPQMEGFEAEALVQQELLPERLTAHLDLLHELQRIHDDAEPSDWDGQLILLAERHSLHVTPRTQLALPGVE